MTTMLTLLGPSSSSVFGLTLGRVGVVHEVRSSEDDDYVVERPVWRLSKKEEQNDSGKIYNLWVT